MNWSPKHWIFLKTTVYCPIQITMFSTVLINQALLLNFFVKISIYLLLPLKWSAHDTCIPPLSHFLKPGYLLGTPDNSNCYGFPLKVRVIESRLYNQINGILRASSTFGQRRLVIWRTYHEELAGGLIWANHAETEKYLNDYTFILSLHLPGGHLLMTLQWEWRLAEDPDAHVDDGLRTKIKTLSPVST